MARIMCFHCSKPCGKQTKPGRGISVGHESRSRSPSPIQAGPLAFRRWLPRVGAPPDEVSRPPCRRLFGASKLAPGGCDGRTLSSCDLTNRCTEKLQRTGFRASARIAKNVENTAPKGPPPTLENSPSRTQLIQWHNKRYILLLRRCRFVIVSGGRFA
jgi:hypothetical protein